MLLVFDLVHVVDGTRVAAPWHSVLANGGQDHALLKTLFEAAKLTTISLSLVYLTVAIGDTAVNAFVLYRSLEKAFAPFTCDDAVVEASGTVLAYVAEQRLLVFRVLIRPHAGVQVVAILRFDDVRWQLGQVASPKSFHVHG